MSLHPDEWLEQAKRAAVGEKLRVRHNHERTADMVVGNAKDRYWCYCQRCKEGGVVLKSHVLYSPKEPPDSRELSMPSDLVWMRDAEQHVQEAVATFLATKNMDLMYLPTLIGFSESRKRLIIRSGPWSMGRDTSGRSPQKWLTYNGQHYMQACTLVGSRPIAILVEDTFSMYKVAYAISISEYRDSIDVFCTLGTAIHDRLFLILLQQYNHVESFYDGDAAGYEGARKNAVRLKALTIGGLWAEHACAQHSLSGNDPKDMSIDGIIQHLRKLYGPAR